MRYLRDRIISLVVTLFLISAVTFFTVNVLPGDPAILILGTEGDPERLTPCGRNWVCISTHCLRFTDWLRVC